MLRIICIYGGFAFLMRLRREKLSVKNRRVDEADLHNSTPCKAYAFGGTECRIK